MASLAMDSRLVWQMLDQEKESEIQQKKCVLP